MKGIDDQINKQDFSAQSRQSCNSNQGTPYGTYMSHVFPAFATLI